MPEEDLTLSPLRLASTDELIAEIKSRFEATVILLMERKGQHSHMLSSYSGGYYTNVGMLQSLLHTFLHDDWEPSTEEERERG
jgi:hypothetical protein